MWKRRRRTFLIAAAFAAVLALRAGFEASYVDFNMDKARQLLIARSFAEGKGFSLCTADPSDPARDLCTPDFWWPAGYPFLVAALRPLAGGDEVRAALLIDLAGAAVLASALALLFRALSPPRVTWAAFAVFTGLTFTPYYYAGSTDLLSAAFYLLALALALDGTARERTPSFPFFPAVGALSFAPALFRYAYYPFAMVPPLFLALHGRRTGNKGFLRGGIAAAATAGLLLGAQTIFNLACFGAALPSRPARGFHPENLLHADPFPARALFFTDVIDKNVAASWPAAGPWVRALWWLLSLGLLLLAARHSLLLLRGEGGGGRKAAGPARSFHLLLWVTLALNVGLLAWYSLRTPPERGWAPYWTFVQETRYYLPSMLLLQAAFFLALGDAARLGRTARTFLHGVLAAALLFTCAWAGWRTWKTEVRHRHTRFEFREMETAAVLDAAARLRAEGVGRIVYADGLGLHNACLAALRGRIPVVLDYSELLGPSLKASAPVTLLLRMPRKHTPLERRFLSEHPHVLIDALYDSDLWRVDLR